MAAIGATGMSQKGRKRSATGQERSSTLTTLNFRRADIETARLAEWPLMAYMEAL